MSSQDAIIVRGETSVAVARDPVSDWLGEQAFVRATGARAVPGNAVRLLRDAAANYPAWLDAIAAARRSVYFENYIFDEDEVGRQFAAALAERARAGVRVRVIRDWLGTFGGASRGFWRTLAHAGVEVRVYNPPRLGSPFGWLSRDHRKMIAVDGEVAFVSGLCVSQRWVGDPSRGLEPWRDTGVEIRGPAVAEVERAFANVWADIGEPLPRAELSGAHRIALAPAGSTAVRVVANAPQTGGLFRLDQIIAVAARERLWLTDAYFIGTTPYVQALRAAARDGVDVRLLLPNASDIPIIRPLSRSRYRSLLEAGVRIFEWNGSMLHAKTAVADGRWARVGSSNLNPASFMSNYELDVAIEDAGFARAMEDVYEDDLGHATEIVLGARRRVRPAGGKPARRRRGKRGANGSVAAAAAGAVRLASAVGTAVVNYRVLVPAERNVMAGVAAALAALSAVGVVWPAVLAWPLAALGAWLALGLVVRACRPAQPRRRKRHK